MKSIPKSGTKNKVCYGYSRVSSVIQADDGISLDAQRAKLSAWAEINDYNLVEVFTDAGRSGGRADNRPGLQAALSRVCETPGAVLVTYSLSRLARSTKDAIAIAERLDKSGANLASLSEDLNTVSASGKMIFRMLAVLAEFEKDNCSERTSTALRHLKATGQRYTRIIPFGYELGADGSSLAVHPGEQAIVCEIVSRKAGGETLQTIADDLTGRGIKPRGGGKWNPSVVWKLATAHSIKVA